MEDQDFEDKDEDERMKDISEEGDGEESEDKEMDVEEEGKEEEVESLSLSTSSITSSTSTNFRTHNNLRRRNTTWIYKFAKRNNLNVFDFDSEHFITSFRFGVGVCKSIILLLPSEFFII